jgi:heptose I phosphotransferase
MTSPFLDLAPEFAEIFADVGRIGEIWDLGDEIVRDHGERRTARIERNGTVLYIKRYGPPRKRLLRRPEPAALAEARALERASSAGVNVPRVAALGMDESGRSLVVLSALPDSISLETLVAGRHDAPQPVAVKRALIRAVAETVRRLHDAGINHRDLYLPHFHVPRTDPTSRIWLIDLQRAQLRRRVPRRWLVKDLGGLWFSAMDAGLTRSDLFRFVATYTGEAPAHALHRNHAFWRAVERRAQRTYSRHGGVPLPPHLRSAP